MKAVSKATAAGLALALALAGAPALAQGDEPSESARPARAESVGGLWCGAGLLRGATLELSQHLFKFNGTLRYRDRSRSVRGSIEGSTLRTFSEKAGELVLEVEGSRMRIESAGGNLALAIGQSFVRAGGGGCA